MVSSMSYPELMELVESDSDRYAGFPQTGEYGTDDGRLHPLAYKMVSEDGTNFLQGIAWLELFRTQKGTNVRWRGLWIAPECRGIGFGKALMLEAVRQTHEYVSGLKHGPWEPKLSSVVAKVPKGDEVMRNLFSSTGYTIEEGVKTFSAWKSGLPEINV